ncbi:AraC family ligand binding domain-containing protein [Micromonospora sp. M12]
MAAHGSRGRRGLPRPLRGPRLPRHIHDVWTLLIVDDGAVRYDLDRHRHGALRTSVTLLPPTWRTTAAPPHRTASANGSCTSTPRRSTPR